MKKEPHIDIQSLEISFDCKDGVISIHGLTPEALQVLGGMLWWAEHTLPADGTPMPVTTGKPGAVMPCEALKTMASLTGDLFQKVALTCSSHKKIMGTWPSKEEIHQILQDVK